MESGTSEWTSLVNRLEKVEKQNRRFKQIGALALILAGSVLLMGQAPRRRTVEANEFILKNGRGQVRGRFHMKDQDPELVLLDDDKTVRARFSLGLWPELSFLNEKGEERVSLWDNRLSFSDGGSIEMYDKNGVAIGLGINEEPAPPQATARRPPLSKDLAAALEGLRKEAQLQYPGASLWLLGPNGRVNLRADNQLGSAVILVDKEAYATTIGTEELTTPRTGETHKTSAASVILFDKDKKVLWQAP